MSYVTIDGLMEESATFTTSGSADRDSSLLVLICQGDQAALARLYERYSRLVYAIALRVLRDHGAAEDVLQDVFLRIWLRPGASIKVGGSLGPWLAIVARNRAIDVLRQKRPMECLDDLAVSARGNLAQEVEQILLTERIEPFLARLPEAQRRALEMSFVLGWTHAEIAKISQVPLGTIKTRIRTALLSLRSALQAPVATP